MATLNDLPIKSITSMSREELIAHILAIRTIRRQMKKKAEPKERKPRNGATKERGIDSLLAMLSPAQVDELLSQIGGDEDDE